MCTLDIMTRCTIQECIKIGGAEDHDLCHFYIYLSYTPVSIDTTMVRALFTQISQHSKQSNIQRLGHGANSLHPLCNMRARRVELGVALNWHLPIKDQDRCFRAVCPASDGRTFNHSNALGVSDDDFDDLDGVYDGFEDGFHGDDFDY